MIFATAGAVPGTLLWRTVEEANLLVETTRKHLPGLLAWAAMMTHFHVGLAGHGDLRRLAVVMRVYARKRNRLRGERGPVWAWRDLAWREERNADGKRILLRYCSLNPCRKDHLYVKDPLAWPWTSHRGAVGLAIDPLVRPLRDPERYHGFVVSDPVFSRWEASRLPVAAPRDDQPPAPRSVLRAVAALLRTTPDRLLTDRRARRIAIGAARALTDLPATAIADVFGVHPATVGRVPRPPRSRELLVRRVLDDPRFEPWTDAGLAELARRWHRGRR